MFFLSWLRYIRGYVEFSAQGVFVERFLNLSARERIPVWDGRKRGGVYIGRVPASGYKKLRPLAKKAGVRLRIQKKTGVPFQRRKYRRRKGLLIGLGVFTGFLFFMSGFIWRIEVGGLETVGEAEVLSTLEQLGVSVGTWRSDIDVRETERLALLRLHDLSWIALNIDGSTIRVEVSEAIQKPPMVEPDQPCNIVAGHTGRITLLRVLDGQALVRQGDTVLKGDLVISGITQDRIGQHLYKHALGEILAEINYTIDVEIPLEQTTYEPTGKNMSRTYYRVLGLELPFFIPGKIPEPYKLERSTEPVKLFSQSLPLAVYRENYVLMRETPVTYTEQQAKDQALAQLAVLQRVRLGDAEILNKEIRGALKDGKFVLTCDYVCILDIGVKQPILTSRETQP